MQQLTFSQTLPQTGVTLVLEVAMSAVTCSYYQIFCAALLLSQGKTGILTNLARISSQAL